MLISFSPLHAGSDNLAVMLTLAVFFMLTEPKYYQRLRKELDEAFPDPGGSLPPAELAVLPFLNGVLAEVLRLSTPFFLPRIVPSSGVVIDGRFVPGGTIVAYAAYTQQLHPDNFCPEPRVSLCLMITSASISWSGCSPESTNLRPHRSSTQTDGFQAGWGRRRGRTSPSSPPSRSVRTTHWHTASRPPFRVCMCCH